MKRQPKAPAGGPLNLLEADPDPKEQSTTVQ